MTRNVGRPFLGKPSRGKRLKMQNENDEIESFSIPVSTLSSFIETYRRNLRYVSNSQDVEIKPVTDGQGFFYLDTKTGTWMTRWTQKNVEYGKEVELFELN